MRFSLRRAFAAFTAFILLPAIYLAGDHQGYRRGFDAATPHALVTGGVIELTPGQFAILGEDWPVVVRNIEIRGVAQAQEGADVVMRNMRIEMDADAPNVHAGAVINFSALD